LYFISVEEVKIMIFDMENITKAIGVITASFAMIGGGYTLLDRVGTKDILTWAPEYFEISDGPTDGSFDVIVAREKHRDDCSVEGFKLEVKDSKYVIHTATPSVAKFSGPASDKIDKFGFSFTIDKEHQNMIAEGIATLLAHIYYKCPEGSVVVNYPDHENLQFKITEK
jgi:hypothetical protein